MRCLNWLFYLGVAGCGFGDNLATGTTHHACGDGIVDPGEGCDDGNTVSGDGCSSTCQVETHTPVCGNGIRESGEACDDGNTVSGDGCSSTCQLESVCGDGIVEAGETCDDGNTHSGDGCSSTCQVETEAACGLIPQSSCAGGTPACDLTAADDGTTACRAVTKQGTSNDHCPIDTDCKAGYTCVHDDTEAVTPWCMRFCTDDGDCNGAGSRCVDELADNAGNALNIEVCSNACDLYTLSGCPSGLGCVGHDAGDGDFTDCEVMGDAHDGASCVTSVDCLAGSMCVDDGAGSTCEPTCIVGDDITCDSGTCIGFVSQLVIGAVEYGTCL